MVECRLLKESLLLWIRSPKPSFIYCFFMQLNSDNCYLQTKREMKMKSLIVDKNFSKDISLYLMTDLVNNNIQ